MPVPSFAIFNGLAPENGPKSLSLDFQFATSTPINSAGLYTIAFDLFAEEVQQEFGGVQSIYVDNSNSPTPFIMDFGGGIAERVVCPGYTQGVFPVFVTDKCSGFAYASTAAKVSVEVLNVPMPLQMWDASPVTKSLYIDVTAATTNITLVKAGPGILRFFSTYKANTGSFKFFDTIAAPVLGTDIPKLAFTSASQVFSSAAPNMPFVNNIYLATTLNPANSDNTPIAASTFLATNVITS